MKPSFIIHTQEGIAGKHLFIFPSKKGITFIAWQREGNIFTDVLVCKTPEGLLNEDLQQKLADNYFLRESFSKVDIIWGVNESIIVPQIFYNKEKCGDMLKVVYGNVGKWQEHSELMLFQNGYNVYRVDEAISNIFLQKFPTAHQTHQSTVIVNFKTTEKDLLYCNFCDGWLTVMLRKNNQLQIIQNFDYVTPEDAAYHLLNLCQQFSVTASATIISASGMIEKNSHLYRELYKYFAAINFCDLPQQFLYADEIVEFPQQYFSHFILAASCVL